MYVKDGLLMLSLCRASISGDRWFNRLKTTMTQVYYSWYTYKKINWIPSTQNMQAKLHSLTGINERQFGHQSWHCSLPVQCLKCAFLWVFFFNGMSTIQPNLLAAKDSPLVSSAIRFSKNGVSSLPCTLFALASAIAVSMACWIDAASAADALGMGTAKTMPLFISSSWLASMGVLVSLLYAYIMELQRTTYEWILQLPINPPHDRGSVNAIERTVKCVSDPFYLPWTRCQACRMRETCYPCQQ